MTSGPSIDCVLVQWGERLFYPRNRIVKPMPPARLDALTQRKAAVVRSRIVATVSRRVPQVMVKVTGGGRGMAAIAAHFRYISKNGRLDMEDDRGVVSNGKEAVHDLVDQWRYGGSLIEEVSPRREAFNIMLSMPQGTDPKIVKQAAREFAQVELKDHSYVMVLHEHQANPHVHLSVRAESRFGARLNPRKTDLHRWRETFAEKLRGRGIEAEATRQATRGANRTSDPLWRVKARGGRRLLRDEKSGTFSTPTAPVALAPWRRGRTLHARSAHRIGRRTASCRPRSRASFAKHRLSVIGRMHGNARAVGRWMWRSSAWIGTAVPRSVAEPTPRPAPRAGKSGPPDGLGGCRLKSPPAQLA